MLLVTTQKGVCTKVHPIHRQYHVDHLNLDQTYLAGQWYIDWMPARTKSITQAQGSWVITNGKFTEVYPKSTNSQESAKEALIEFCQDIGPRMYEK